MTLRADALAVPAGPPSLAKSRNTYRQRNPQLDLMMITMDEAPEVWHIIGVLDAEDGKEVHRERQSLEYALNQGKNKKYAVALRKYDQGVGATSTHVKLVYAKRVLTV